MTVNAQYARDHFDELLLATDNGEEVEVSREGKPSIKLLIMPASPAATPGPIVLGAGRRILGAGEGLLHVPTDQEWRQMKEDDARLMNDAPLMTTGHV